MKKLLTICSLLMLCCYVDAQTIKGRVYRGNSDTTIANAVVYYSGSTNGGTITDKDGRFEMAARSVQIPIVVSCVGYFSSTLYYHQGDSLIVHLKPKAEVLKEVVIRSDGINREDEIEMFKKDFLGTSEYAKSCTITNIDDVNLHYNKKTRVFSADCDKPVIIENTKLGYTITYYLDKFEKTPKMLSMAGSYTFKDNVSSTDRNFELIQNDRENVYNGSRMQFIRALWYHRLNQTIFRIYTPLYDELSQDNIVVQDSAQQKYVHLNSRIYVINREDKSQNNPLEQRERYTFIDKDGFFGDGLIWSGMMGDRRIGDLLPFEYQSGNETKSDLLTTSPPFKVANKAKEKVVFADDMRANKELTAADRKAIIFKRMVLTPISPISDILIVKKWQQPIKYKLYGTTGDKDYDLSISTDLKRLFALVSNSGHFPIEQAASDSTVDLRILIGRLPDVKNYLGAEAMDYFSKDIDRTGYSNYTTNGFQSMVQFVNLDRIVNNEHIKDAHLVWQQLKIQLMAGLGFFGQLGFARENKLSLFNRDLNLKLEDTLQPFDDYLIRSLYDPLIRPNMTEEDLDKAMKDMGLGITATLSVYQKDEKPGALFGELKQLNTLAPQEKVHLHLDKPYYSVGEDIWLKAYVVDAAGNSLSDRSKILYVDLLDERDSIKQTLLLPVINGTASGNVHLSDSLLMAGNYHICAYTKWMQNFGSEYFFRKDVAIVNALKGAVNTTPLPKLSSKPLASVADVQFFPEGGHLVSGIRTKIGFKALKPDGLGEDINGYVVEDGGTEHLAEFQSEHAGMGVFGMLPVTGKTYNAIIKHADGSEKRYPLPKADESGYVLNVNRVGDSLSVRISAGAALADGREVALIAQCNGVVKFAAKTKMDKVSNLSYIPASKFPTGIIQFTLFSPTNMPVAERLIFVDRNDGLTAGVTTDKPEYTKRGKVNIGVDVKDFAGSPAVGSFSVAVTDQSKVNEDENNETTILSNLLLTSDIKGHIEQPNYYFNKSNPDRSRHLDQLLLTQGWRRFSWTDLLADKFPVIKYQPEQGLAVTGSVLTLGNKPVPKAKVTLFAKTGGFPLIIDTIADEQGHFVFDGLDISDSTKVMVKAIRGNNGTQVKTIIDRKPRLGYTGNYNPFYLSSTGLDNYLQQTREQFTELAKLGLMKNSTMLKEVTIKAIKERDKFTMAKMIPHSANLDPGSADYVIKQDKLEHVTYLTDAILRVPGLEMKKAGIYSIRAENSLTGNKPMLVILDGAHISQEMMSTIAPVDIIGVEILTGNSKAIYGSDGSAGVIIITTKRGGENDAPSLVFNIAHYTPQGYTPVKEFYSPAYDTPNQSQMADLRSTIYWNPDVVTGADGKASFSFYNADGTGTYKVTLEGMDTKGGLLRKVFTYVVK